MTRATIEEQFALFGRDHAQLRAKRLKPLEEKLFALQTRGEPMFCSAHILNEVRWLLDPNQAFAIGQEFHDGSWGVC